MRIRFGDCALDTDTRELFRGASPVRVTPKAFQLLEVLVENRPKAISKAELQERLWPGTYVSEANLASLVAELREAIGDDARNPRFVRTVYGYGYAFSGDAAEAGAGAATGASLNHRLLWGDREIPLAEGQNVLGRGPDSVAWIDMDSVSRHHARIVISGEKVTLEDLGSKNGTYLNGHRVAGPVPLSDGDEIKLGSVRVTFRVFREPASTQAEAGP